MKNLNKLMLGMALFLGSCALENTPDYILKYSDPIAYDQRMLDRECHTYGENRMIQVEGVAGQYDYNSNANNGFLCYIVGKNVLLPYEKPTRYAPHRSDIKPFIHNDEKE
ncbi:MAG: hypothetical protein GY793_03300 [Proteobacteria bacterium]|nr:hypothetical protein [Pseudomonadota bacterium]